MNYLWVFLITVAVDIAWTMYISETGKGHAIRASSWSAAISALGGMVTIAYMHDQTYIIAAVAGAFVGTYITLKWKEREAVAITALGAE